MASLTQRTRANSGDSEGPGSLACCSLWSSKKLDTTEQLNNNDKPHVGVSCLQLDKEGILVN